MFTKPKKTFGESSGRLGMPSARKPRVRRSKKRQNILNGAKMSKKPTAKPLKNAIANVPMSKKPRTGRVKGKMNSYRTAKAVKAKTKSVKMSKKPVSSNPKQDDIDARLGSYFSGIKGGYGF